MFGQHIDVRWPTPYYIILQNQPPTFLPKLQQQQSTHTHPTSMFRSLTKPLCFCLSYSQRALPPKKYSEILQQNIKDKTLPQIMHSLYLYENDIQVFDYDYYQRVCYSVLDFQSKLPVRDICTILNLGLRHSVRSQVAWKHLQAELHRRLYNVMNPLFQKEKIQAEQYLKSTMRQLQQKSNDHFQLLTPQFINSQTQTSTQFESQPQQPQPLSSAQTQKNKQITARKTPQILSLIDQLIQPIIWYGSTNTKFLSMLLQTKLHPLSSPRPQPSPKQLIKYAQLLTYICQVYMKQYQSNKKQYTARSIKKIYKYQSDYIPYLISHLELCIADFNVDQIKYLRDVVASFPIKKRQHRLRVVEAIANQLKKRSEDLFNVEVGKLEELLGNDQKLVIKFRKNMGIISASTQENNEQNGQKQNENESQNEKQQKEQTEQQQASTKREERKQK